MSTVAEAFDMPRIVANLDVALAHLLNDDPGKAKTAILVAQYLAVEPTEQSPDVLGYDAAIELLRLRVSQWGRCKNPRQRHTKQAWINVIEFLEDNREPVGVAE